MNSALSLLLAFASAVRPDACTCVGPLGFDTAIAEATAVFTGRVESIAPSGHALTAQRARQRVDRAWKWRDGGAQPAAEFVGDTPFGSECGVYFREGDEWLVVAFANQDTGALWTRQCAGSDPLKPPADEAWNHVRERVQERLRWLQEHLGPGSRPAA
jgi:hypothetical protein